jgi:hypothetical protein
MLPFPHCHLAIPSDLANMARVIGQVHLSQKRPGSVAHPVNGKRRKHVAILHNLSAGKEKFSVLLRIGSKRCCEGPAC